MTNAKPAKLRDGSWGARVAGTIQIGESVQITTAGGKSWTARVTRVVWTDGAVSLCATQSQDRQPTAARSTMASWQRGGDCRCAMCTSGNESLCRRG